jgi:hypothetical protein
VDVQKQDWKGVKENLNQTVQLYPFSAFWKKQKADFDKQVGASL